MVKKLAYFFIGLAVLLVASYFLQPIKKGKGLDKLTKYELVKNWLQLPAGFKLGAPTGISIDTKENIVVFHRAEREWPLLGSIPDKPIQSKAILIIDKNNGKLMASWGADLFIMP